MAKKLYQYCLMCGRRAKQVPLIEKPSGYICRECESIRIKIFGEAEYDVSEGRLPRLPDIFDEYKRHKVEVANQAALRKQFHTKVENPKDPAEKERLRQLAQGNQLNNVKSHPILADKVQFNGINEETILPTMDPEQMAAYLEHQLQLQNQKRLERQHQQSIKMNPNL